MKWTLAIALTSCAVLAIAQAPPPPAGASGGRGGGRGQLVLIPKPGVTVADADQKALRTGLARLNAKLDALKGNPRLADVQIFEKAVRYGLDGNEFFTQEESSTRRNFCGCKTSAPISWCGSNT